MKRYPWTVLALIVTVLLLASCGAPSQTAAPEQTAADHAKVQRGRPEAADAVMVESTSVGVGWRLGERVKVGPKTKQVLRLSFERD